MSKFIRNVAFTLSVAVISFAAVSIWGPKIEPPGTEVQAAPTTQTKRRIYAYLEGDWTDDKMFIHYTGGTNASTWTSCPEMTQVVDDYYTGLFYYDIDIDHTTVVFKKLTGDLAKLSDQSVDVAVSDLFPTGNYKVAAVKAWVADDTKRAVTAEDTAPANSGQIAAILNHINSCSADYATGFNAWPQLYDLFIQPRYLEISSTAVPGESVTVSEKLETLKTYTLGNTTTYRIYVVLKPTDWTTPQIWYWGNPGNSGAAIDLTEILASYSGGKLYYADISKEATGFKFRDGDWVHQTGDMTVSSVYTATEADSKAVWVETNLSHVFGTLGTGPMADIATIFSFIDSNTVASWGQIKALFIAPSWIDETTVVVDNFGGDTTILDKITWLETKYDIDQAS